MPDSTLHDVIRNILDEPIPEAVKGRLLKPLKPRKYQPPPTPRRKKTAKKQVIDAEFDPLYRVVQNILDASIPEAVKERLLKPLKPRKYQPIPPPRRKKAAKRKAIEEEFDPLPCSKGLRSVKDYEDEILEVFEEKRRRSNNTLTFWQTPWTIGNFLRGWQMDVPRGKSHMGFFEVLEPFQSDPRVFLEVAQPQIRKKLKKELKDLGSLKFQLALKVLLKKSECAEGDLRPTITLTDPVFRHEQEPLLHPSEIGAALSRAFGKILETIEKWLKEGSGILYLDANNLYGWAMNQHLPTGGFRWVEDCNQLAGAIADHPPDAAEGYILEVDLDYPRELHGAHNAYPLAPERLVVQRNWMSEYQHALMGVRPPAEVEKLFPNLRNKERYVVHYRNLQLYLSLGMKLKKVHRGLCFFSPWKEPYIRMNTELRKQAASDFEKDLYKLMNNSVFGKTMENLRKRVNVKLVRSHEEDKLRRLIASPSFARANIFDDDLAALHMHKSRLTLNRPIYVGMSILDLSKYLMYDFYYTQIKVQYGDRADLLYTDTDSLLLEIQMEDVYRDMGRRADLYDTSDYPKDHPLYNTTNKKVLGKMKDECTGRAIEEYVGLRPKMYSILEAGGHNIKKAKGVRKNVVKKHIRHEQYKEALFSKKTFRHGMDVLRSKKHHIYGEHLNKISLSPFDSKRRIAENGVDTHAYGYRGVYEHLIADANPRRKPLLPEANRAAGDNRGGLLRHLLRLDCIHRPLTNQSSEFSIQSPNNCRQPLYPLCRAFSGRQPQLLSVLVPEEPLRQGSVPPLHDPLVPVDIDPTAQDPCLVFGLQLVYRTHKLTPGVNLQKFRPPQGPSSVDASQGGSNFCCFFRGQRFGLLVPRGDINYGEGVLISLPPYAVVGKKEQVSLMDLVWRPDIKLRPRNAPRGR
ncbi:hypothetical protein ElyMa_002183000 [Elysia marginata]|uniref:DNA-directed DNA polymerase n=1 Tax=Elysia marginata TaxID=1093978 RepID=A0AAV4FQ82_9GAST|nr:hypothetical protein ElyMa_002183000 [Elysia marginata]